MPAIDFTPGCARTLHQRGLHPRLFLSPGDIDKLRRACRSGWCKKVLQALRVKTKPLIDLVHDTRDLQALLGNPTGARNGGSPEGKNVVSNLDDIAMVGLLDNDPRAIDAARKSLVSSPETYGNNGNAAYGYDLMQPCLSPSERGRYIEWAVKHIDHCIELAGTTYLQSAGGNIRMTYRFDALGLCLAIRHDEGAPDLSQRQADLVHGFEAAIYASLGPEGYPAEDIGYGTLMTGRLLRLAIVLRRAGIYDAFTQAPRLANFGRAMLHFVQPWGEFLSNTGDHGDDFGLRDMALGSLARLNNDPTLIWLMGTLCYPCIDPQVREKHTTPLSRETLVAPNMQVPTTAVSLIALAAAPKPARPRSPRVPTTFRDSDRGIVSFRTGWRDDDTYIYFDGSQRPQCAQGHAHDSGGHFTLSALGEYFAVSPGRYGIEQDQHNTVLVDGKSGRSTDGEWRMSWYQARLIDYQPGKLCDYAAADTTVQSNCYWAFRHMGLVHGPGLDGKSGTPGYAWTVDDVNGANDRRSFWWTMYVAPNDVIEIDGLKATVKGGRRGNLLDVRFAHPPVECYPNSPHKLAVEQDMPWTSSHKYVSREWCDGRKEWGVHHHTIDRPRLVAKLEGVNGRIMTVMVPRLKGGKPAKIEQVSSVMGALAMRLDFGKVVDTVVFAHGHSLLEADGIRGRGRWAVVRRDARTRRLLAHQIHLGDWLEVDGKRV